VEFEETDMGNDVEEGETEVKSWIFRESLITEEMMLVLEGHNKKDFISS